MHLLYPAVVATLCLSHGYAQALVSKPGDRAIIPGWRVESTSKESRGLAALSQSGIDVSKWYKVSSRGTLMASMMESGVYNDQDLFFSDHLSKVDPSVFEVPWLYRQEFQLQPRDGQHFAIQTNGITSRADIYVNGKLLASKDQQVGAYGGQKYDITSFARKGVNTIVIRTWPTNYSRDFAIGFEDWNPYPPDNGTGSWRNTEVFQSGSVSISPPRVVTDYEGGSSQTVTATIKVDLQNYEAKSVVATVNGAVGSKDGTFNAKTSSQATLKPHEQKTVSMSVAIKNAQIWWPSTWGKQPMYEVSAQVSVSGDLSDIAEKRSFGIRDITSHVNSHNDTAFTINGSPFLVMGAGYTPDIFLRFDSSRVKQMFQTVLDLGLNTIRLEGKQEQPELYDIADEMGLMVMPGWECCDKWEGWLYNDEGNGVNWTNTDYPIAGRQMKHEAAMMQSHPSLLAFLVGSDFWPDDRATKIYVDTLNQLDWPNPIIASAAKRGYPKLLGPSGMKMDGPYDWVPPNYWYGNQLGAALGFGSELGAGVGTPELTSLKKFLSDQDLKDLWTRPNKDLYHMSRNPGMFANRKIYNNALYARYGAPKSLDDYLLKAQLMDYEATRSQYESYAAKKNADRPATGLIYWMLNGAWPSLHWQLFDQYLAGAGSYYGTKMGTRMEHVVYDYDRSVYLVSHSLTTHGQRKVSAELIDIKGKSLGNKSTTATSSSNKARELFSIPGVDKLNGTGLLKLVLQDDAGSVLSRNTYWIPKKEDVLDWDNSTWYYTPVTKYADMKDLFTMDRATVHVTAAQASGGIEVTLQNTSDKPAFFLRLELFGSATPAHWSDNYLTLWPRETLKLTASFDGAAGQMAVVMKGGNVPTSTTTVGGYSS